MKLAYLAQRRGDMKRAIEYIEKGKANHSKDNNQSLPTKLYCMKGRFLTDMGNLSEAYKEYQEALKMSNKRDSYARVGIANIHYQTSTFHRNNAEAQESELRKAMQQYFSVLELEEMNTAGALGIGNVLAEYNKVAEAKEIFKVIENSETDPTIVKHALLNHAHLLMNEENNDYALNLYQAAHEKFPNDLQISLYLAKAHFKRKNYTECEKMTTRLLIRYPNEFRLKFNLALCLYDRAVQIYNLEVGVRRVKQTEQAVKDLNIAKSLFNQIIALQERTGGAPATQLMPSAAPHDEQQLTSQTYHAMYRLAEERLSFLNDMLLQGEYYLSQDKDAEAKEMEQQREREQHLEEQRQREQAEKMKRDEEENRKKTEAREAFYDNLKKNQSYELNLQAKQKKTAARRNTADAAEDGAIDDADMDNDSGTNDRFGMDNQAEFGMKGTDEEDGDYQEGGFNEDKEEKTGSKKHKSGKRHRDKSSKKSKKDKKGKKESRRLRKTTDTANDPVVDAPATDPAEESKQAIQTEADGENEVGQKRKRLLKKSNAEGSQEAAADGEASGEEANAAPSKRKRTIDDFEEKKDE